MICIRTLILVGLLAAAAVSAGEVGATTIPDATNSFAQKLLGELRQTPGNLCFSPYSIHAALTMAWTGARGETAAEMSRVLDLGEAPDRTVIAAGHAALAQALAAVGAAQVKLEIANALFGAQGHRFLPDFLALNRDHFHAGLEFCDFAGQPEVERQRINAWVAEKTARRIAELLPPKSIDPQVLLVLVNAVWYQADWATPFDPVLTTQQDFFPTSPVGARAAALGRVPLMHRTGELDYFDTDLMPWDPRGGPPSAQVVVLPYAGDEVELVLVVPKDATPDGLERTEAMLGRVLAAARTDARRRVVDLFLPRFELRWGTAELNTALISLGMPTAFLGGKADFSGIITAAAELFISHVYHQTWIRLDEVGTEAAAATGGIIQSLQAPSVDLPPVVVRADHPFLFVLRHRASGVALFVGRVADPVPRG
jgi:serpin B